MITPSLRWLPCLILAYAAARADGIIEAPRIVPADETQIARTLHVAAGASTGGDGSAQRPFQRIMEAIRAADRDPKPTRLRLAAGIYRETIDLVGGREEAPLLVIEGAEPGVVVSGSDRFTEWTPRAGRANQFEHVWNLRRGWEPNPWPGLMPMTTPGFRHELLFVDGEAQTQVYDDDALRSGTYWVDEDGKRLVLEMAPGLDPRDRHVEVSVRPVALRGEHSKLVRIVHRDNVVLRGFAVRHAMTPAFMGAVQILGSRNVTLEDLRIEWNSGGGLVVNPHGGRGCGNVTLRRVRMDHNGFIGLTGGFEDGLLEDCTTNGNNWRGVRVGATGWAPCGWKLSHVRRAVLRRHHAIGNHASGGWFDDEIHHVRVEGFVGLNNLRSGLSVEATEGPLLIVGAFLAGNSTGLNVFDSRNLALVDSTLVDNTTTQIRLAGSTPMDPAELATVEPLWRRVRLEKRQVPTHVVLRDNRIGVTALGPAPSAKLITLGMRESAFVANDGSLTLAPTVATLRTETNVYAHPGGEHAPVFSGLAGEPLGWEQWRALTSRQESAPFDEAALATARSEGETSHGVVVRGYAGPDPLVAGASAADALEL